MTPEQIEIEMRNCWNSVEIKTVNMTFGIWKRRAEIEGSDSNCEWSIWKARAEQAYADEQNLRDEIAGLRATLENRTDQTLFDQDKEIRRAELVQMVIPMLAGSFGVSSSVKAAVEAQKLIDQELGDVK
jgi:hypothetical protein